MSTEHTGRYVDAGGAINFLLMKGARVKSTSVEFNGPRSLRILGAIDYLRRTHFVFMHRDTVLLTPRPKPAASVAKEAA